MSKNKSIGYENSELQGSWGAPVQSFPAELGTRLGQVVALFRYKKDAADVCGVTAEQLKRYLRGKNAAPFEVLAKLAAAKNINLNWLATGQGDMFGPAPTRPDAVDEELLGRISDGISKVYKDENARLAPIDQGRLAGQILNKLVAAYDDPAERTVGLKLALEGLRAELRRSPAAGADSDKRSA